MERTRRTIDRLKVFVGELIVFGVFILFLRIDNIFGTLLMIFGIGGVWYLFDKSDRLHTHLSSLLRKEKKFSSILALLFLVVLPLPLQDVPYLIHLCMLSGIYVMLATGLNYQLGSTNIVNFATAAAFGVGAYTSALLSVKLGVNFWLLILIAGGASGLMGLILGLPTLKTKDYYLSLVTLAFGLIIYLLLNNFEWTGGPNGISGIPAPVIFGHSFRQDVEIFGISFPYHTNFYYLVLFFSLIYTLIAKRLHESRTGLAWNAIRENEIAAQCSGIDTVNYKILSFCINCFLDGMTGAIYAHYISFISPENFQFTVSLVVVTMVIFGGMDNVLGVVIGAIALTLFPEKFRIFADYRMIMYGVIVILALVFRPKGLFPEKIRTYIG
jgi:ABC-type branched-subunit amino acid transport system permease subunit